jgi:hypothetical protein
MSVKDGTLIYLTANVDAPWEHIFIAFKVKEAYRSGNSVVYERIP